VLGWGVSLSAYAVLQTCALLNVRGSWRIALSVPIPPMLVVVAHMMCAYYRDANLWPMTMLMTAPGALLAVVALWAAALISERRWLSLLAPVAACAGTALVANLGHQGLGILWTGEKGLTVAAILIACGATARQVARFWRRRRTSGCS
jgi:hypothetical protein